MKAIEMMHEEIDSTLNWIDSTLTGYSSEFQGYHAGMQSTEAEGGITESHRALVRFALAVTIPSPALISRAYHEVQSLATEDEIKHAICIATGLRAGAAIAYGRLAFKMLDQEHNHTNPVTVDQIRLDREYMTHFRRGSPKDFDRLIKLLSISHRPGLPLSKLTQELIAVACATITQCVYCMEKHVKDAKENGATAQQISQVVHLAIIARMESTLLETSQIL